MKNKTIVITGAAGGMGQALCHLMVEKGFYVLAIDHNQQRLEIMSRDISSEAFIPLVMDLKETGIVNIVEHSLKNIFRPVYGLVNLAGISQGDNLYNLTDDDWQDSFQVNAMVPMQLARMVAPKMKASGGGSIINVSSPVGLIGARKPSYAASKSALLGLTMSMARNLGKDNIRVNMVLPGATITFMTADWSKKKRQAIAENTFLGRLCEPKEFAKSVSFLLSEDSSYMTGAILDLTAGGMVGH